MTTTREPADHAELTRLAEAATPGPWDRMAGRGLVRAIRDDLAVPLFEPLEPYSDPLLDAPTCRVGGKVVFRANSQAARESAAIRQAVHNATFIAAANPATVLALLSEIAALRGERDGLKNRVSCLERLGGEQSTRVMEQATRAKDAERQRDEAVGLLRELADGRSQKNNINEYDDLSARASALIANQGADHADPS